MRSLPADLPRRRFSLYSRSGSQQAECMPTDPDPVGSEIVLCSVLSDTKVLHRWGPIAFAPCRSLQHSCTIGDNDDSEFGMIDRKYVVVMRDGTRGVAYIAEQNVMGKIWL